MRVVWAVIFFLLYCSCTPSNEEGTELYLNALNRGLAANQHALLKMDTVLLKRNIYENQKFLVDFSLYVGDTINKNLADKLLELSQLNNSLKNSFKNRERLIEESKKIQLQLAKLDKYAKENNSVNVFEGLCHELNAVKLLTQTVKNLNQQVNQNLKLADSLKKELAVYLKN